MEKSESIVPDTSFDFDRFLEGKLNALNASGAYRQFLSIEKNVDSFPEFQYKLEDGSILRAINWCTNDYLAMSTHRTIIDQLISSTEVVGTGSGGTRNISGNTIHHQHLESKLADWHQQEKALLFNSAYQANLTALSTLGRHIPDLVFISDEENHASMIEGMRSVKNKKVIFRHNDPVHLEFVLNSVPDHLPKIIVFESVYSISGTVAPIKEIMVLAKKFKCLTYIDEVHAVGLYGDKGAGLLESIGLAGTTTLINGTLSKAIGVFGGYLAGSRPWIDFLRSYGSGFIFTTSLPPAICAAASKSIAEIAVTHGLRQSFFENVIELRSSLIALHIPFTGTDTHITRIHIGDARRCKQITDRLLHEFGIYVQPINQPTVPEGQECLRITITPKHTRAHINHLVGSLQKVLTQKMVLTGRSSMLSKVQLNIVKEKINQHFPLIEVEIKYKESRGDQLKDIPLHTQEGTDFFTKDIFNDLSSGQADIAVHSLKDLSSEHFFGTNGFAVADRDETRDMAIFHPDILKKLRSGAQIRIGTCSFRRESMALNFLKDALPQFGKKINLLAVPIRGNIDTRLTKLSNGEYDGLILAVAGISRMLTSDYHAHFQSLMNGKKWMVLPLVDCIPAPCQGAIVAEAAPQNEVAMEVLRKINDPLLYETCKQEKKIALRYGSGCIQQFGVTGFTLDHKQVFLAKGSTENGHEFEDWYDGQLPTIDIAPSDIISSDELGYTPNRTHNALESSSVTGKDLFIAHINAIKPLNISQIESHRIWTAGTATWFKLASQGLWVEGCADSMGFESIAALLKTSLVQIDPMKMVLLTNSKSALRWQSLGYHAYGMYDISYQSDLIDKYKLTAAKLIFWNCYAHYEAVESIMPDSLLHACLPGKTADTLRSQGIHPIIFPTINAFNQWKKNYSQAYYAA